MGLRHSYSTYARQVLSRRPADVAVYRKAVHTRARAGHRLLHLGCGWDRSGITRDLTPTCEVIGVDVDPAPADRYHSPFWLTDGRKLPFGSGSFDVVCSEYVFEHVERPDDFFREVARVLRPGGWLVALTPSRWSYKSLVAAATPHWFHELAAKWLRPDGRDAADVYPTHYRMNTASALSALCQEHGMSLDSLSFLNNGPTWFRRTPGLFEVGRAYHAALDRFPAAAPLRCGILLEAHLSGEIVDGPRALAIRCNHCDGEGMQRTATGYLCPACDHRYTVAGPLIDARP